MDRGARNELSDLLTEAHYLSGFLRLMAEHVNGGEPYPGFARQNFGASLDQHLQTTTRAYELMVAAEDLSSTGSQNPSAPLLAFLERIATKHVSAFETASTPTQEGLLRASTIKVPRGIAEPKTVGDAVSLLLATSLNVNGTRNDVRDYLASELAVPELFDLHVEIGDWALIETPAIADDTTIYGQARQHLQTLRIWQLESRYPSRLLAEGNATDVETNRALTETGLRDSHEKLLDVLRRNRDELGEHQLFAEFYTEIDELDGPLRAPGKMPDDIGDIDWQ